MEKRTITKEEAPNLQALERILREEEERAEKLGVHYEDIVDIDNVPKYGRKPRLLNKDLEVWLVSWDKNFLLMRMDNGWILTDRW